MPPAPPPDHAGNDPDEGARRFEALRVRGHRGGVIHPHRSMAGLPWSPARLGGLLGLAGLGLAGYGAALPLLLAGWQRFFERGRNWLGLKLVLGEQTLLLPGGATLRLPELSATTPQPDSPALVTAGAIVAAVLGLTLFLPRRWIPGRAILRMLAIVQGSAVLFFAASPDPFPYRIADALFGTLAIGLIAMALVPILLGLTLYPLDLALWRKAAITVLLMAHFAVLTPLLTLLQAGLLLQGTAVLMPTLFLGAGVLPFALVFLAMYGWAASWPSELASRRTPAPVHSF
jgi:hypothetical protein